MGPFAKRALPNLQISPIGEVPKSSGSWRMITHLYYHLEINALIDPELCSDKNLSLICGRYASRNRTGTEQSS